jgi:Peptidase family M28
VDPSRPPPADFISVFTLHETMRQVLALPREAGTPDAERARNLVTDHLSALGYRVTIQRFSFLPSALLAFPVFGAGLGGLGLLLVPLLVWPGIPSWGALLVWLTGIGAVAILSLGVGLGWVALPGARREDANLIVTRGDAPVRRWLVAHLDTKAQAQSMAGRLVAVWLLGLAIAGLTALVVARLWGSISPGACAAGVALALIAGALAGRGRIRGTSPGARDNGSGLTAVLAAAEQMSRPDTGILITGAEEFGLVGARVFAQLEPEKVRAATVINLDTLDDEGALYLVSHDRSGHTLASHEAARFTGLGTEVRLRRLPPGILVDSLPLARAGAAAVTIGRLTWGTLRRIHTPKDTTEGFSLRTAEAVGRALAAN